jgi:two-component system chemotaxis family response regulator WspR
MVLLVDDQLMIGEAVRRAFAGHQDIDFHFCSNPAEAITVAEQIGPTVILQDLVMPGVDGLALVRAYRAHAQTRDIPIIVLSTKEEPDIKSAAFAAGANDYLVKLPDKLELIARVRYHTKSYLNQLQRDEAYRALRESQQQLMQINLELQRLNNIDGLTGLTNKRCMLEFIESEWRRAARERTPLSILMVDVDYFKRYNDTYGHLAGDDVLKRIAGSIQASVRRPADIAARFGGEEFIVLLPATPQEGARAMGEKLRESIAELRLEHSASSVTDYVTVSVGGASTIPLPGSDHALLIDAADKALYAAKHGGRDRVVTRGDEPSGNTSAAAKEASPGATAQAPQHNLRSV